MISLMNSGRGTPGRAIKTDKKVGFDVGNVVIILTVICFAYLSEICLKLRRKLRRIQILKKHLRFLNVTLILSYTVYKFLHKYHIRLSDSNLGRTCAMINKLLVNNWLYSSHKKLYRPGWELNHYCTRPTSKSCILTVNEYNVIHIRC